MRGNAGLNTAKKEERRMSGSYQLQLLELFLSFTEGGKKSLAVLK